MMTAFLLTWMSSLLLNRGPHVKAKRPTLMSSSVMHMSAQEQMAKWRSTENVKYACKFSVLSFECARSAKFYSKQCVLVNESTTLRRHAEAHFAVRMHFYNTHPILSSTRENIRNGPKMRSLTQCYLVMSKLARRKLNACNRQSLHIWLNVRLQNEWSLTPTSYLRRPLQNGL